MIYHVCYQDDLHGSVSGWRAKQKSPSDFSSMIPPLSKTYFIPDPAVRSVQKVPRKRQKRCEPWRDSRRRYESGANTWSWILPDSKLRGGEANLPRNHILQVNDFQDWKLRSKQASPSCVIRAQTKKMSDHLAQSVENKLNEPQLHKVEDNFDRVSTVRFVEYREFPTHDPESDNVLNFCSVVSISDSLSTRYKVSSTWKVVDAFQIVMSKIIKYNVSRSSDTRRCLHKDFTTSRLRTYRFVFETVIGFICSFVSIPAISLYIVSLPISKSHCAHKNRVKMYFRLYRRCVVHRIR